MQIQPEQSSQWMTELHQQMVRCKQVLLYGNVADQFLLNGNYCGLAAFLRQYFVDEGYEIVGQYDVVDGFSFADDADAAQMAPAFWQIVRSASRSPAAALGPEPTRPVPPTPAEPPASDGAAAARRSPLQIARERQADGAPAAVAPPAPAVAAPGVRPAAPRTGSGGGQPLDLDQALEMVRRVLEQRQRPAAFVIHFADKVTSANDQPNDDERRRLVQWMKVIEGAAFLHKPPLHRRKNALVIVARQLGAIPEWLHKDNPFLALVRVPLPRSEERLTFLRTYISHFHEGRTVPPDAAHDLSREFANLTDGFTAWDLDAVLRTSVAEKLSIHKPKALVDYYVYGIQDDPWQQIEPATVRRSHATINSRVVGQPRAVQAVVDMLVAARVGISMTDASAGGGKPKGTLFFVGPTGVGKTELAKALTQLIFSDETAFARFDMSEYSEEHAAEKLTGAPPGFVGYEEGGLLTNRVRERPFSLLLFDEIEKAHGKIMDKFLQILEDGRLSDGKGQTAHFSQSVIIFTSNIGSSALEQRLIKAGGALPYEEVEQIYRKAVRRHFTRKLKRPEILNRLGDNIIVFDILRPEFVDGICNKFLRMLTTSTREKKGLTLTFPGDQVQAMIRGMMTPENLSFGGRRIKTLMETLVERPLNRWFFENDAPPGATLEIVPDDDRQSIRITRTAADTVPL